MPYFCQNFCLNDPWESLPRDGGKLPFGTGEMMTKPASAVGYRHISASLAKFRDDERGAMAIFFMFLFVLMLMFGGIAVDVMRYETRRVAMQQTMDRAALAAASLDQELDPEDVVEDYFAKAALNEGLDMVDFSTPVVTAETIGESFKSVKIDSSVRSRNFFMHMLNVNFLEGPTTTTAQQGIPSIEIMLVLDVSTSMGDPISTDPDDTRSKIEVLRDAAQDFVTTVKDLDFDNQVSIGVVPYNAQVNLPTELREQFPNVAHLARFNGVATGFPGANCMELASSTFTDSELSQDDAHIMAAVADTRSTTSGGGGYFTPSASNSGPSADALNRMCTTNTNNAIFLPTRDADDVKAAIGGLTHGGYTSIFMGMRWGVALADEAAAPIYQAIGDESVADRPLPNDNTQNRKIIVLMTDGEHYETTHVKDAYKTGLSPIYKGADGKFAIRIWSAGPAPSNGTRPTCAGTNTYFVPHLKTGTGTTCVSASWRSTASWTGSGTVRQLDWSEVWAQFRVSYVVRQFYMRAFDTTSSTTYNNFMATFVKTYMAKGTMDDLLDDSCQAAQVAFMEVYTIAFAAPTSGQAVLYKCASVGENGKDDYYFNATDNDDLEDAFQKIAVRASELRLTQ
jgi:Flp pilus assembly protein TadG